IRPTTRRAAPTRGVRAKSAAADAALSHPHAVEALLEIGGGWIVCLSICPVPCDPPVRQIEPTARTKIVAILDLILFARQRREHDVRAAHIDVERFDRRWRWQ